MQKEVIKIYNMHKIAHIKIFKIKFDNQFCKSISYLTYYVNFLIIYRHGW